jgi:hypothetical protein
VREMGIDRIQSLKRYIGEAAVFETSGVSDPGYTCGRSISRLTTSSLRSPIED